MLMVESFFFLTLVYLVFVLLFFSKKSMMEESSCYECGFDPFSFTRMTFSYRFFLISILFIIFDVEISLMLPIPFLMESESGFWIFYLFIGILILGLIYEYSCGSLDWLDSCN